MFVIDTGKRYHIVDTSNSYYKLNEKNSLVIAVMEKMNGRQYTPRKLSELFDQQQRASA